MRILVARWGPGRTVAKLLLKAACDETGVQPRPNWLHPSVREMRDVLEPVATATGLRFVGALDADQPTGTRSEYQSEVRWGIYHPSAGSAIIKYDVRTGRVRANLSAPSFREFREALPAAIKHANSGAQINRVDSRKEMAVALMATLPIAPFCVLPSVGPGVWLLAIDSREYNLARRFLSHVGCATQDLSELEGHQLAYLAVIQRSLDSANSRFGTRIGWRNIAQRSHDQLVQQVKQFDHA